jgi:hypothetical protein
MHFDEGKSKLFSFGEDVVAPGESPIKVEPKILNMVLSGKLDIVQLDGRTRTGGAVHGIGIGYWIYRIDYAVT